MTDQLTIDLETAIAEGEHMDDLTAAATVVPQPCRENIMAKAGRAVARRFITPAETAALLEVSEDVLRDWRAVGYGPQPAWRPEGRLYDAARIERLAALPKLRRMLAIGREKN